MDTPSSWYWTVAERRFHGAENLRKAHIWRRKFNTIKALLLGYWMFERVPRQHWRHIKQWKLFREARVTLFLKNTSKPGDESQITDAKLQRLQSLDQSAEGVRESLENLQSRFKNQLETVKGIARWGEWYHNHLGPIRNHFRRSVLQDPWLTIVGG